MSASSCRCDVFVIGGGVMGASAAYHLAAAGVEVGILERGLPGREASGANAGTLAVQNKLPEAVPAVLESLRMWGSLLEETGIDAGYERRGGMRVAHTYDELAALESQSARQRAKGAQTEMIYGDLLRREAPYLHPRIPGASYCAMDSMANPFLAVRGFLEASVHRGVRLWSECRVFRIVTRGAHDFVIHTSRGRFECSTIVSAAGAWNRDIAQMIGINMPITYMVQQAVITINTSPVFEHIVTHINGNITLKQKRLGGRILIGGAWPGAGDPAREVSEVKRESLVGNLQAACETIPAIAGTHLLRAWTGFEGRTPDRLLLAGPVGPEGFFLLGCAAGGFTMSPLGGRIIADHVLSRVPPTPVADFLPARFLGALETEGT